MCSDGSSGAAWSQGVVLCDLFEGSVWNWSDDAEVLYDTDHLRDRYGAAVEVYFTDRGGGSETGITKI